MFGVIELDGHQRADVVVRRLKQRFGLDHQVLCISEVVGIERHQRVIGLMQEDLAVRIGQAAVDRVAAHHRNHVGILLRLVLPDDPVVVGEVERVHRVRERRMHIHHVADDQRTTLMAAQHPGRERPGHLQFADIGRRDLLQLRVTRIGVVTRRHHPVVRVLRHLDQLVIGTGAADAKCRHPGKTSCQKHLAHNETSHVFSVPFYVQCAPMRPALSPATERFAKEPASAPANLYETSVNSVNRRTEVQLRPDAPKCYARQPEPANKITFEYLPAHAAMRSSAFRVIP
ncbi:hypothetical protein GALL_442100 [mine drainage metagenome]|uniref:Uncharacterized protein n=1 Tax=mine drainage metagenome TaxID=410659 RepID=A0A1J5PTI7_9ZZZZ